MKEEKFPHTRKPLHLWRRGWVGRKLQSHRGERNNRVQKAKRRDSHIEDQCRPALTSLRGLSAHLPGWVGSGSRGSASEVRSQGEDWGWLHEHSLKGASAPQLAGRESGKKSGTA